MAEKIVRSPVTGTVWKIEIAAGDAVADGAVIMILESMKMEIPIAAPSAGTLSELRVWEGDQIEEDQPLAVIDV